MGEDKDNELSLHIDDEQVRALFDLEKLTKQSVSSLIKEGLDMYIKFKKCEASKPVEPQTMLSPIVFEPPYRKDQDQ